MPRPSTVRLVTVEDELDPDAEEETLPLPTSRHFFIKRHDRIGEKRHSGGRRHGCLLWPVLRGGSASGNGTRRSATGSRTVVRPRLVAETDAAGTVLSPFVGMELKGQKGANSAGSVFTVGYGRFKPR